MMQYLHDVARNMAHGLGVPFHVAKVEGLWGIYAMTAPPKATQVESYMPAKTGDGGAAHGRFSRE